MLTVTLVKSVFVEVYQDITFIIVSHTVYTLSDQWYFNKVTSILELQSYSYYMYEEAM